MEDIKEEKIDIPIIEDNIKLKGSIYTSSNTPSQAPFIINLPGLLDHRESYFVKYFSEKFVEAGYYVLSYDYRAHGETRKQTGSRWDKMVVKIFSDIHVIIDWILNNRSNNLYNNQLFLFGRSIGGAIILTNGFINPKIKKLIALCTRFDYHSTDITFPEEIIKKISPKYFLKPTLENDKRILIAHCQDDPRIPFVNLSQIKQALNLDSKNVLEYQTGGHSFKGHRDDILEKTLKFIKEI
jgi:predicted esterase